MIIYIEKVENKILASYEYGKDYNISMQTRAVENTTSWSKERNLTMEENLIGGVHHNLSVTIKLFGYWYINLELKYSLRSHVQKSATSNQIHNLSLKFYLWIPF